MLIFHKQSEPHEVINLACLYPLDTFIKVPLSAMVSNSQMNSVPQFIITLWSCSTLWKSYVLCNILYTTRWLQWILRLPFRGDEKMSILYSLKEYANYARDCMITNKILHMFHIALWRYITARPYLITKRTEIDWFVVTKGITNKPLLTIRATNFCDRILTYIVFSHLQLC